MHEEYGDCNDYEERERDARCIYCPYSVYNFWEHEYRCGNRIPTDRGYIYDDCPEEDE